MTRAQTAGMLVFTFAFLHLPACPSTPPVNPPGQVDAAPLVQNTAVDCALAETRIRDLGCVDSSGRPLWVTPGGLTFSQACAQAPIDWHPAKLATITDCSKLDSAFRGL